MTNTATSPAPLRAVHALDFGDVIDGREHLGFVLNVARAASREYLGYVIPYCDVLLSCGSVELPAEAIVALGVLPDPIGLDGAPASEPF